VESEAYFKKLGLLGRSVLLQVRRLNKRQFFWDIM